MTDTQRTKAALATLLSDNITQQISPQGVRDFLETMHPSFGLCYVTTPAESTISVAGTYVKGAGTTTSVGLHRFTMPVNNRLTYTGTPDIHVFYTATLSMTTAGTNVVLGFKIAKNDVVVADSEVHRKVATGTDVGAAPLQGGLSMSTNDYLELWVANITNTSNITLELASLHVIGFME